MQLQKLLDLGRWFTPFPEPPSQIYLVAVVAFAIWTIVSVVLYIYRRRFFKGRGALIGVVTRLDPYAITIGGLGLFFLAMRYLGIPYFDIRALLYLTTLAAIGYLGFLVYYMYRRYPKRIAEVQAHALKQRYQPDRRKKRRH